MAKRDNSSMFLHSQAPTFSKCCVQPNWLGHPPFQKDNSRKKRNVSSPGLRPNSNSPMSRLAQEVVDFRVLKTSVVVVGENAGLEKQEELNIKARSGVCYFHQDFLATVCF